MDEQLPDPDDEVPDDPSERVQWERRRLVRLLDEVARLAESGIQPEAFYDGLPRRLLAALSAVAGEVRGKAHLGGVRRYQVNMDKVGLGGGSEAGSSHEALLRAAFTLGQSLHLDPNDTIEPGVPGEATAGNPTAFLLLLVPILHQNLVIGLIEIFQEVGRPSLAIPGFLLYMGMMAQHAGRYEAYRIDRGL